MEVVELQWGIAMHRQSMKSKKTNQELPHSVASPLSGTDDRKRQRIGREILCRTAGQFTRLSKSHEDP